MGLLNTTNKINTIHIEISSLRVVVQGDWYGKDIRKTWKSTLDHEIYQICHRPWRKQISGYQNHEPWR